MEKKLLTIFWYDDIGEQHLYKDVGGIPYALAKYNGWKTTFAYGNINGKITNSDYEKFVNVIPIDFRGKGKWGKRLELTRFLWNNVVNFDYLNMYHWQKWTFFYCMIAKLRNPNIKTYVKLDMDRRGFNAIKRKRWWDVFSRYVDIFTVETKKYIDTLNYLKNVKKKIKYLPNGFFNEFCSLNRPSRKEKVILTVGRLGTYQKNTELLVEALCKINDDLDNDWKVFLVGNCTEAFLGYLQAIKNKYPPRNGQNNYIWEYIL